MTWRYTGHSGRLLPQYLDTATWKTLVVAPGGVYGMQPAPSLAGKVPVPPDGVNWEPAEPEPEPETPSAAEVPAEGGEPGPEAPAADAPPASMSSPSAEDEQAAQ